MGLRVTISLSLVPYSPQGMARYRLPSGLSTSLTGYAANCRPYNYHIGQINIGLPLVLASATVGHVYVSVLRSTGVRHGDRHGEREREPSGMDGRVAETFVILRIFSPQLSFPRYRDIYI